VGAPAQDEEFVLSHCDNIQATGFLEHIKLPHYVDFQSELELRLGREDQPDDGHGSCAHGYAGAFGYTARKGLKHADLCRAGEAAEKADLHCRLLSKGACPEPHKSGETKTRRRGRSVAAASIARTVAVVRDCARPSARILWRHAVAAPTVPASCAGSNPAGDKKKDRREGDDRKRHDNPFHRTAFPR
jgi:hypothetical protein